jgi:hypothetical protein
MSWYSVSMKIVSSVVTHTSCTEASEQDIGRGEPADSVPQHAHGRPHDHDTHHPRKHSASPSQHKHLFRRTRSVLGRL